MPRGALVVIGLLCTVSFLAEGAMVDWGALFLTTTHGFAPSHGGLGYAAFSATMTAGRLGGDRVVRRLGPVRVLAWGGMVSASGFALAIIGGPGPVVLGGFALIGAGASNIVPVLFSAAGRQRGVSPGVAVAAITTLGYAGILLGPAVLGFVAHATSLGAAFALVACLLLALPVAARVVR